MEFVVSGLLACWAVSTTTSHRREIGNASFDRQGTLKSGDDADLMALNKRETWRLSCRYRDMWPILDLLASHWDQLKMRFVGSMVTASASSQWLLRTAVGVESSKSLVSVLLLQLLVSIFCASPWTKKWKEPPCHPRGNIQKRPRTDDFVCVEEWMGK